ncbi:cilia- and flagella-associated protein 91 [Drosophila elegans]|uniref:cilia- and flagella-associated protein 91 n=1 Tax=Drosophila elegans TaxID=30023 RepID=UPI0007E6A90C|nr:cilia- and flagella-associated protein 91 [Drosophila elegans]
MSTHNTRLVNQVKFGLKAEEKAASLSTLVNSTGHRQDNVKRVAFSKQQNREKHGGKTEKQSDHCLLSCLITSSPDLRMVGGANDPAPRNAGKLPRTDSECQFNAPGFHFLTKQDDTVKTHEVKLNPRVVLKKELKHKCDFFAEFKDTRPFKNKITQTLYRESSAQTMNYLPEILDADKEQTLELFSLPSVLPGANPPGLHEVEILERARKRWAFNDALKIHFKRLLDEARNVALKTQHKEILEAFEWENWIQREEDIQECQMLRLEIVIKMFDKREKEMHAASNSRIEKACERIEKCRQAGLRKNEIEFQRGMRRLEFQVTNTPRRWQKQSPMYSLGSPCSEFYAPLLRYGINPARRNFVSKTEQKAFDMRIDELEKRVNTSNLKCPFRKLKDWSKPKKYEKEYERNFCNDDNLQKLFENLKALRTQAAKEKAEPKCLRKRWKQTMTRTASQMSLGFQTNLYEDESDDSFKEEKRKTPDIGGQWANYIDQEKARNSDTMIEMLKNERIQEGLENILNIYEGTYIGWVMQFLSEEMTRLAELRRLHFFSIMCQKERWRREAAEAGLRQKENDMRLMYEELFQHCNVVNNAVSNEYISTILNSDMYNVAEGEATETVGELARQIDADIERWLESFKLIQNPLTFVPLRLMLKEQVSPNMNEALQRHEKSLIVHYVVEDVIFRKVWLELDPFDIASTLTSDLIDRLIDNDLYLMSTDSESEIPQKSSWREAHAIVRKLIRQAVPGRRWLEDSERIVTENYNDLIDDIFASILYSMENPPAVKSADLIDLRMTMSHSDIRSSDDIREKDKFDFENLDSLSGSNFLRKQTLSLMRKFKIDNITRPLENLDKVPVEEQPFGDDEFIGSHMINPISNTGNEESDLFSMRSTLDMSETLEFLSLKGRGYRVVLPQGAEKNGALGVLKLLEKEDNKEEQLELSGKQENYKEIYIDSPKVPFDQMLLSSDTPMELYYELPQPSKSPNKELKIEKEDVKPLDSRELTLKQMDATPKELERVESTLKELKPMDSTPKALELMDSNPKELELKDSNPKELEHIVDIVDSTFKELIPTTLDSKDLQSIDSIPKDLEPPKEATKKQELNIELEPEPLVSHSSSFIPPVRSSGPKVLNLPESLLKPDEIKEKAINIKMNNPDAQKDTEIEEKGKSVH